MKNKTKPNDHRVVLHPHSATLTKARGWAQMSLMKSFSRLLPAQKTDLKGSPREDLLQDEAKRGFAASLWQRHESSASDLCSPVTVEITPRLLALSLGIPPHPARFTQSTVPARSRPQKGRYTAEREETRRMFKGASLTVLNGSFSMLTVL